jgi:hypothetical protein
MNRFLLVALLAGAFAAPLAAQTPAAAPTQPTPTGNNANKALFRCTLPGGVYEVAVGAMIAVTSHEYLVDGVARVVEVNIDTTGSLLARFYFIEPNTPNTPGGLGASTLETAQKLLTEGAEKTGQDVWKKVVKSYPTTTHSRTVEYRLESREQLNKVYAGAEEAFRLNKDTRLKIE